MHQPSKLNGPDNMQQSEWQQAATCMVYKVTINHCKIGVDLTEEMSSQLQSGYNQVQVVASLVPRWPGYEAR